MCFPFIFHLKLLVHPYFDLQLALSHKSFFISFTSAAAANVILTIVSKSKMFKVNGLLSFMHAHKKLKHSLKCNFVFERTFVSRSNVIGQDE